MAHLKNSITDTSQLQQNNLIYKKNGLQEIRALLIC